MTGPEVLEVTGPGLSLQERPRARGPKTRAQGKQCLNVFFITNEFKGCLRNGTKESERPLNPPTLSGAKDSQ